MFSAKIGDDVEIRLVEERDAGEIYSVVERERLRLREWLLWADSATRESNLEFIQKSREQCAQKDALHAGIWSGGRFAGGVGCHKIDWINRKVEIGYWLASEFEGRGIVTAACRALVDHLFNRWELHRVEIHCATSNARSNAVARRLGFRLEATLREAQCLYGRYYDLNIYGMLAPDWRTDRRMHT